MASLTLRQRQILDALAVFIRDKGYAPSQMELAGKVGLKSANTVDYHLGKLEKMGFVKCPKNRLRAIEMVSESLPYPNSIRIPILETLPAGGPDIAMEQCDEFIDIDRSLAKGKSFALRVKDDRMKDSGIFESDIVIVRVQPTAENGEIVLARYMGETCVSYLRRNGEWLYPANDKYKPIRTREAEIIGKVAGVIRRF